MHPNSFDLAWIVVNDIKQAVAFYTEVLGLKLIEFHAEYGWAELSGKKGGARIGIAQKQPEQEESCCSVQPGQNAVMTFTVDDIEVAVKNLIEKGAKLMGTIIEVPGHVKMQTVSDVDGNQVQLVEVIQQKHHHQGCCAGH